MSIRELNFLVLLANAESVRVTSLVLGIVGVVTGLILLVTHQRIYDEVTSKEDNVRIRRFERRKFRRRAAVGTMISSVGCLLASLRWVTDVKIFAIFILLIMGLLIGILGIAFFDMFSVGLQTLAKPQDASARQAMIDEYLRQKKRADAKEPDDN